MSDPHTLNGRKVHEWVFMLQVLQKYLENADKALLNAVRKWTESNYLSTTSILSTYLK